MVMLQWPGCKVKDMAGIPRNTADFLTSARLRVRVCNKVQPCVVPLAHYKMQVDSFV